MSKIIIGILALAGCLWAIGVYAPSLWTQGFMVQGILIRYAYFAIGSVGYLVYKMKAK